MLSAKSDDVIEKFALQADLHDVLPIDRESMPNSDTAARPKWEIFAYPYVLSQGFGDSVRFEGRNDGGIPNSESTDFSRRGHIPLQQNRRDRQHTPDVVKAFLIRVVSQEK